MTNVLDRTAFSYGLRLQLFRISPNITLIEASPRVDRFVCAYFDL